MIASANGLEVVAPENFNPVYLEDVIRSKQKWILEKLAHFDRAAFFMSPQPGNKRVLYRGHTYEVETEVRSGAPQSVEVDEGKLVVTVPEGSETKAPAVLEKWYRRMARLLINQRVRIMGQRLNVSFNRVFIKDQKTRWGSCSHKKNLNFNWRLVMAPLPVLDYVVVHELIHLIEPNHSKKFWSLVEKACPDYRDHRAWLKKYGKTLRP